MYNPEQPPSSIESWSPGDSSILPENTSASLPDLGGGQRSYQSGSSQHLNGEQIDWLLKRLSTDDQQEVGKILRECTWQMTTTRGLPFAALVTGSMYFARTRLPEALQFGPKRWPFYGFIAFGSLCTANLLSMNTCGDRVKPKMFQLYQKYSTHQPGQSTTYDSLRAANRQQLPPGLPPLQEYQQNNPTNPPQFRQRPGLFYDDQPPPMSGTPVNAPSRPYGSDGSGFSKS